MKNPIYKALTTSCLLLPVLANAGEVVVNSPSDSGFGCTLREAVASINAGSGLYGCAIEISNPENRIIFRDFSSRITLSGGEIRMTKPVEIDGEAAGITINANGNSRIFNITHNTGTTHLKNITLTNGNSTQGSAIRQQGSLRITNASFVNNTASNSGGAIYSSGSQTLVIENSRFTGNTADSGGAIWFDEGILTILNTTVARSQASTGGAIYVNDAPLFVENSVFTENSGGAIAGKSLTASISKSTFSNNVDAPAIWISSGDTTVSNSTFYQNRNPFNGGAIRAQPYSPTRGGILFSNNTFWGNTVQSVNAGGAISLNNITARADSNLFLSNTAGDNKAANSCWLSNGARLLANSSNNVADETVSCLFDMRDDSLSNVRVRDYRIVVANQELTLPGRTTINIATLADNGCQTKAGSSSFQFCPRTIALIDSDSNPAIDNGKAGVGQTGDQRGVPFDDAPDSGSYELVRATNPGTVFSDSFETP